MNLRHMTRIAGACLLLACAQPALAQAPNLSEVCVEPKERLDKYQYLRALSLDLRGHIPSLEEYEALHELDDVPQEWIQTWMSEPAFGQRAVRWHKSLLWNNVAGDRLFSVSSSLTGNGSAASPYRRVGGVAIRTRGHRGACGTQPARFNASGELMLPSVDGEVREGWVEVNPYWAPNSTVRVCALDARDDLATPSGQACGDRFMLGSAECGCGPELKWCAPSSINLQLGRHMTTQLDLMVADNVTSDRSYVDLFTTDKTFINGHLNYYWRNQPGIGANIQNAPSPYAVQNLPEMEFEDESWVEVSAGEHQSGILTAAAYLIRFQTDRARANQLFTQFMCQPFEPSGAELELGSDEAPEADLQQREGCADCHRPLEAAAAHWGRWPENGAGYLSPEAYPAQTEECKLCAETGRQCTATCRSFYTLDNSDASMEPFAGYLKGYLFRRPEHFVNVETGPKLLVRSAIADNRLPNCVTKRNMELHYGRPLTKAEQARVDEYVRSFAESDYSYKSMITSIVTSETYRRVR